MKSRKSTTDILRSLRNSETEWTEKLKLAHMLMSSGSFLPNKLQIISDWSSQEIINSTLKNVYPKEMFQELMQILVEVLKQSQKPHKGSQLLTLRPGLIEAFTRAFNNEKCHCSSLVECCSLVFANADLCKPLTAKFEKYVNVFASALNCLNQELMKMHASATDDPAMSKSYVSDLMELNIILLQSYMRLQKQQSSPLKVFVSLCDKLLRHFVLLKFFVLELKQLLGIKGEKLSSDARKSMQSTLWTRETLEEIKKNCNSVNSDSVDVPVSKKRMSKTTCLESWLLLVQSGLKTGTEKNPDVCATLAFIPDMFLTFLEANRDKKVLQSKHEFTVFTRLSAAVLHVHSFSTQTDLSAHCFRCIGDLLEKLISFDVFKINDDSVNNDTNRQFLESIANVAASSMNSSSGDLKFEVFRCLQHLLDANHLLLEPHLPKMLKQLIIANDVQSKEDVKAALKTEDILGSLLVTYGKTRQIEKFLNLLTDSVNDLATGTSRLALPQSFLNRLEEISTSLPTGQALSVLQMLLNQMCTLVRSISTSSVDNIKNVDQWQDKLGIITAVFQILSVNIHIIPHGGHGGVNQQKYLDLMKQLKDEIMQPLIEVCPNLKKNPVLGLKARKLVWKLLINFQRIELFLLQHNLLKSSQHQLVCHEGKLLPSQSWCDASCSDGDEESKFLETVAVTLYLKTAIFVSNDAVSSNCVKYLESLIVWLSETAIRTDSSTSSLTVSTERKNIFGKLLKEIVNELPWLGSLLGSKTLLKLNEFFLFLLCAENVPSASPPCAPHKEISSSTENSDTLLSAPYFYDNFKMQESFCTVLTRYAMQFLSVDAGTRISHLLLRLVDSNASNECEMPADKPPTENLDMGADADNVEEDMDSSDEEMNQDLEVHMEASSSVWFSLSDQGKDKLRTIWEDFFAVSFEPSLSSESETSSEGDDAFRYLQTINRLHYEWLLPECKIKLLAAVLLLQKQLVCCEQISDEKLPTLALTFVILSKIANSTITAHRLTVWEIVDPATILHWILMQLDRLKGQNNLPLEEICGALESVLKLLLKIKRAKFHSKTLEGLATKVYEICEETTKEPSSTSLSVTVSIFSIIFKAIRNSQVKKYALVTAMKLVFPSMQLLISTNLPVEGIIANNSDKKQQLGLLKFRGFFYVTAVCISMKLSRKFPYLVSMQEKLSWKGHFETLLDVTNAMVKDLCQKDCSRQLSSSTEQACLEFLQLLYSLEATEETTVLKDVEFARQIFSSLFTLATRHQNLSESTSCVRYYELMNNILDRFTENNLETLLGDAFDYLESNLDQTTSVVVSLRFFAYLLGQKKSKEDKFSFKTFIRKLLFICIELIAKAADDETPTSLVVFDVIVKALGFSKSIVQPSHCTAILHVFSYSRKETIAISGFEVFIAKLEVLSVLLFNYRNAVYTTIASYVSGVRSLLSELSVLYKSYQKIASINISEKLAWKTHLVRACEKFSRLYQEISSHKQIITKYAPYLIADYLRTITSSSIAEEFQNYLTAGIYCIMDTCTRFEFSMLNMVLSQGDRELFKMLHNDFSKHHKFQGKA